MSKRYFYFAGEDPLSAEPMEADTHSLLAIAEGQIADQLGAALTAFTGGRQYWGIEHAKEAVAAYGHLQALLTSLGHYQEGE